MTRAGAGSPAAPARLSPCSNGLVLIFINAVRRSPTESRATVQPGNTHPRPRVIVKHCMSQQTWPRQLLGVLLTLAFALQPTVHTWCQLRCLQERSASAQLQTARSTEGSCHQSVAPAHDHAERDLAGVPEHGCVHASATLLSRVAVDANSELTFSPLAMVSRAGFPGLARTGARMVAGGGHAPPGDRSSFDVLRL